jgi:hypothetical protein
LSAVSWYVLQEAVSRTTALRDALGQLHGQLEELREDHKQLQVCDTAT